MNGLDLEAVQTELEELFQRNQVVLAYLFGSQARGESGRLSDVDIAVLISSQVPEGEWGDIQLVLISELMGLLRRNDIDLLILNRATPLLADRAIRYGNPIYEPDPLTRVRFETETLRRYLDTRPLRKLRWAYLERRIEHQRGQVGAV